MSENATGKDTKEFDGKVVIATETETEAHTINTSKSTTSEANTDASDKINKKSIDEHKIEGTQIEAENHSEKCAIVDDLTHTTTTATPVNDDGQTAIEQEIEQSVESNEYTTAVETNTTTKHKAIANATNLFDEKYAEHVTYTEDGTAIYTDPQSNYQYKWCAIDNKWKSYDSAYENEHYTWCSETKQWKPKANETEHYKWNAEKNEWTLKKDVTYGVDEDGQRTYTDKDGVVYFWDTEKNAWFPKIDDDFMARYQMSYGFIDNTSASAEEKRKKEADEAKRKEEEFKRMTEEARAAEAEAAAGNGINKRKAKQEPPKWFDMDPEQNTKVYVSNLPLDITLDEFAEVMGKCGLIMRDPQTQKYKLKLYTEKDGQIKGDGLCDYIKVESVHLALNILDESEVRGHKIRVQRAQFQMRGEYNPALKPKRKKKDKEKLMKMKEKLFDWRPEKLRGERSKNEKVVIIKNLFNPEIFENEVQLILDYTNDLREECGKCGTVRKVVVYDRHADGVAQINMSTPEEADSVIQMMHGRFFGKRQLSADYWDGKTKYKINESETEVEKRLSNWDEFLESDGAKEETV